MFQCLYVVLCCVCGHAFSFIIAVDRLDFDTVAYLESGDWEAGDDTWPMPSHTQPLRADLGHCVVSTWESNL